MMNIPQIMRLAQGNPQDLFNNLMQTNPNFAEFVRKNQNKSPEQIAADYGVDLSVIRKLIG